MPNLAFIVNANDRPVSFADLAEKLMPSVVNISTTTTIVTNNNPFPGFKFPPGSPFEDMFKEFAEPQKRKASALGSGFIIDSKGIVITNNHVINGCQNIKIHANDKVYLSTLIASDIKNDLALLKSSFEPNFVFPISSSPAKLMEEVYVAGFPFGHNVSSRIKVTKGIISSLAGLGDDYSRFQIDAAVQPGNSGGPIYDNLGNVVGVTVAKLDYKFSIKNYSTIPELTNFGIKSSMVRSFLSASNIQFRDSVSNQISNLGEMIQNGSFYISCFMTKSKYNEYKNKKVLLDENNIFNIQ